MNMQRKRSSEAGFTLVELLIVMSVILIIASLALPKLMNVLRTANETSAITSLRTLNSMEGQYMTAYPTHGFACSLASLGGKPNSGLPTPEAAQLINEDLSSGSKSGYTFSITCGAKNTINNQDQFNSYTITAVPNSLGHSGNRGYCTDESGVIHYDPKGGTNCTELLQ